MRATSGLAPAAPPPKVYMVRVLRLRGELGTAMPPRMTGTEQRS